MTSSRHLPAHLLLDGDLSAAANMARDQHLLNRAAADGTVTVRLYGWAGFTLSVGRTQRLEREIDLAACRETGTAVVRRTTGGQAVLHGADLTYSVAAPLAPFGGAGVLGIYRELSQVFVHFFTGLGLDPAVQAYSGRQRAELASAICFATPSAFEITLQGRKILGSAQRQTPRAFLQHGSLPLRPQPALLARLFKGASPERIAAQMTDLESEGVMPGLDGSAVRTRLVQAFEAALGMDFTPAPWSAIDDAAAQDLEAGFPDLRQTPPPDGSTATRPGPSGTRPA